MPLQRKVPFDDDNIFKPNAEFLTEMCMSWGSVLQLEYHFLVSEGELWYFVIPRPFSRNGVPAANLRRYLMAYTDLFVKSLHTKDTLVDQFDTLILEAMLSSTDPKLELDLDFQILSSIILGQTRPRFNQYQMSCTYHARTGSEINWDIAAAINRLCRMDHGYYVSHGRNEDCPWESMKNVFIEALDVPRIFRRVDMEDVVPSLRKWAGYVEEEEEGKEKKKEKKEGMEKKEKGREVPWLLLFDIMARPQEELEDLAFALQEDEEEETTLAHILTDILPPPPGTTSQSQSKSRIKTEPSETTETKDEFKDKEIDREVALVAGADSYATEVCSSVLMYLAARPTLASLGMPNPDIQRDVGHLVRSIFEINADVVEVLVIRVFILLRRFCLDKATWPEVEKIFMRQVGDRWENVLASILVAAFEEREA